MTIATLLPVSQTSACPLGRERIAAAERMRCCRTERDRLCRPSPLLVLMVVTSWSPMSRDRSSAKLASSMPEPTILTVEADHSALMPLSPQTPTAWA